jgi:hypothetical protein
MATPSERLRAAWAKGDAPALSREVEQLAAEGHTREILENALESLLHELRTAGVDEETEESINGVWDRLTGWCHPDRQIVTVVNQDE